MSTFTSPPSDPAIVLLWGDRWWIGGRSEPVVFGEVSRAAETLLAHFAEHGKPAKLRLIYQPSFLVSVAVQCPHGNRATLQAALQDEHPPLAQAHYAWSYEPIHVGGNATLLHYENEPALLSLVDSLRDGGLIVEGAWPLATALNLVPEDWPDTGALTVVAVARNRSVVFRHTPSGLREVHTAKGERAAELAATTVQHAFEREDTALYIVALDDAGARLALQVAGLERPGRTDQTWDDVVRAALTLSPTQPNQLLPAPSRIGASRIVTGITTVALLTAGVLGAQIVRETVGQRTAAAQTAVETEALRTEITARREFESATRQISEQLVALTPRRAVCVELLRILTRKLPSQVVLTRVQADRAGFVLAGGISGPGLAEADWRAWCETLQSGSVPWQLVDAAGTPPVADFALKGVWR